MLNGVCDCNSAKLSSCTVQLCRAQSAKGPRIYSLSRDGGGGDEDDDGDYDDNNSAAGDDIE